MDALFSYSEEEPEVSENNEFVSDKMLFRESEEVAGCKNDMSLKSCIIWYDKVAYTLPHLYKNSVNVWKRIIQLFFTLFSTH